MLPHADIIQLFTFVFELGFNVDVLIEVVILDLSLLCLFLEGDLKKKSVSQSNKRKGVC